MKATKKLVEVAAGRQKADLVFKNANVVNVFTEEILQADVAVQGGYIAGVGRYSGHTELDCTGKTLCPGFVDAHLHVESSMVLPHELVRMVLPWGTTTLVTDPHEIVNVCGAKGVQFMLDASENLPCNFYVMLPSSVPATGFETSGAVFTAQDMRPFIGHKRVLGLGEVMGFPDVVAGEEGILEKIEALQGYTIDGHAPGLGGASLQAYRAAGVNTEHEATTFEEALEKLRAGFALLVREGSAAHNVESIVKGLVQTGTPSSRCMFCTDDKHSEDIGRQGHISWNIKLAIQNGMNPVQAVCMASWNAAKTYGLRETGAVAAGFKADLVLLDTLEDMNILAVYKDGVEAKQALAGMQPFAPAEGDILYSVKIKQVHPADFRLAAEGPMHVIEMVPYQLTTSHLREAVPQKDGMFTPQNGYTKLCVVERHGKNGNIAVAPLKGYGLTGGAIATTVAHDSHNILAAGDNDADIALAVNHLAQINGGYVLVKNGQVIGGVPLCVAGLMSSRPFEEVENATGAIIRAAREMGIPPHIDPFISLSFLALPVIPSIRLTDKGLFDVEAFTMVF